jgi:hypothetical protein
MLQPRRQAGIDFAAASRGVPKAIRLPSGSWNVTASSSKIRAPRSTGTPASLKRRANPSRASGSSTA